MLPDVVKEGGDGVVDSKIVLWCYTYQFLLQPPHPTLLLSTLAVPNEVEEGINGGNDIHLLCYTC